MTPRNPYVTDDAMRAGEERIFRSLDIYKAIAEHPNTVPQSWVDRLFYNIKNGFPRLIDHWAYSEALARYSAGVVDDPRERRRNEKLSARLEEVVEEALLLRHQFEMAYSRQDKIIAIDAFMHAHHINGSFLTRLFLTDSPINTSVNSKVNRILTFS